MATSSPQIRFTLRQLQYFSTVARTGQISLAAEESHVTQSAMTAAIAELEKKVGAALFERSRTGVVLTHQGHLFLQHAQAVLEAAEEAARQPFREQSQVSGTIKVAASYTVLGYFLLPFIAKFQKQHPGVTIIPVEQDREQIEASVAAGEIEIAVALTSNMSELRRFQRVMLARSRRQLWISAGHALANVSEASLADIVDYPYILPMVDEGNLAAMRYWKQANLQPASFIQTSSLEAVREMVALDLGVTILSDMLFRPWSLEGRRIKALPLKDAIPPMELGLIWLKTRPLGEVAETFRRYLQTAVGGSPADRSRTGRL